MSSQNPWTKTGYREKTALQQPNWPDRERYEAVIRELNRTQSKAK